MQIHFKCISPFVSSKTFKQNILSPSEVLLLLFKEETIRSNIFPFCGQKNNRNSAFYYSPFRTLKVGKQIKKYFKTIESKSMTEKK